MYVYEALARFARALLFSTTKFNTIFFSFSHTPTNCVKNCLNRLTKNEEKKSH